jgi:hypothetical protein
MLEVLTTPTRRDSHALREVYGELHRLGLDLRDTSVRFQELVRGGSFTEHGREFRFTRTDPKEPLNRSIDITRSYEFLVAMTGAFSSGKSTLLNLLLDEPDLLPASVIPMTAVCTAIRHGIERRVQVRMVPFEEAFERVPQAIGKPFHKSLHSAEQIGEALESPENFVSEPSAQESLRRFAQVLDRYEEIVEPSVGFAERAPYISGGGILPDSDAPEGVRYYPPTPQQEREYLARGGDPAKWVTREWLAFVRDVTLWVPSPVLQNDIVILDLPGLNCREDYHRRAIREYCNMADGIVVTAFQPGNQADEEIIEEFKNLSTNFQEKIFFVFNKIDQFASEPQELVRAVDYLTRDTIGEDFPRDRFFLTSGHLARNRSRGDTVLEDERSRLANALRGVARDLPGLSSWVEHATAEDDPGGIGYLRERIGRFLVEDAYPAKIREVTSNYEQALGALRGAASPTYETSAELDADDVLRRVVLEAFRKTKDLGLRTLRTFRFSYVRGSGDAPGVTLEEDLKGMLEDCHEETEQMIRDFFEEPILTAPLRDDPVSEFDLLTIADEASQRLRRTLQDRIIDRIRNRIGEVLEGALEGSGFLPRLERLLRGVPEARAQLAEQRDRFLRNIEQSLKCIVRNGFFHMPRGRELKRLERSVPLADLRELLTEVFVDYYPSWIYQHIHNRVLEELWLSVFLDAEDFETALARWCQETEASVLGIGATRSADLTDGITAAASELYRSTALCQEISGIDGRLTHLTARTRDWEATR